MAELDEDAEITFLHQRDVWMNHTVSGRFLFRSDKNVDSPSQETPISHFNIRRGAKVLQPMTFGRIHLPLSQ
jgi:hypothetical protein